MMTQRIGSRTSRFPVAALLFSVMATAVLAQQVTRPADVPTLPARGSLTVSAEAITEILSGIKAPQGFEVKVFAAPSIVNYPTCLTATLTGELFVCVDRNSSLQADPGMGSVLRLVDRNNDGQADDYTVFATMDSPRGAVFDGDTLYVTHPPSLTAYRDGDGDGVAEESRTLVRGLGFGLDFRGADHTVNNVELGIDGWLYIAVGDSRRHSATRCTRSTGGRTSSTATRCSRAAPRSRLARKSSSACHGPPISSSMAPPGCSRRAGRAGSIATLVSRSGTSPG
jgi:glucose/arabinose dehydrogenase